ncbi:hypothetical protein Cni_G06425 [Canna indica]|uniref:Lactate/malate dehydrogenase N-terminal domain-containing protein n=1 Tax=Canna indica TaxID=4628 RepID=A0AAQ3Q6D2_9LILI|nr:hypothetical protein Cni_G06425 [Canna indica]
MAIAQTILTYNLADELTLVDAKPDMLHGEMIDLRHTTAFLSHAEIVASPNYLTANSDLCIIIAVARQLSSETRLNLLQRNLALLKHSLPQNRVIRSGTNLDSSRFQFLFFLCRKQSLLAWPLRRTSFEAARRWLGAEAFLAERLASWAGARLPRCFSFLPCPSDDFSFPTVAAPIMKTHSVVSPSPTSPHPPLVLLLRQRRL